MFALARKMLASAAFHDSKKFVQVYDYVDNYILMLGSDVRAQAKGLRRGYKIEHETNTP